MSNKIKGNILEDLVAMKHEVPGDGVNPPFQTALDRDPGEFQVLHRPGRQWRDGGLAVLPRPLAALQLWR